MTLATDIAFLKEAYPILELVRECQEELGYTAGLVRPESHTDQKTRCPVHNDGNPSAKAYFRTNSVYCWVCGKTWDVPGLYAAHFGVPFPEAVRILMARLGLEATKRVSNDELLAEAESSLNPTSDDGPAITAWLDRVAAWATDHAGSADHLDVVLDEIDLARRIQGPAAVSHVRGALRWAEKVSSVRGLPVPPPPAEDSDSLFLSRLPSSP